MESTKIRKSTSEEQRCARMDPFRAHSNGRKSMKRVTASNGNSFQTEGTGEEVHQPHFGVQ